LIPLQAKTASPQQLRLLALFKRLSEQDRAALTAFAEFLAERGEASGDGEGERSEPQLPEDIARPDAESVVAAIKRLTRTYPMLQRQALLNETSTLMTAHVLQGRAAGDVVDELEIVFRAHYENYRRQWDE
jgi:hypothetical protein